MKCPLCNREMSDKNSNLHHLIPKSKKGRDVVRLHKICHNAIHAQFKEGELARTFNTIEMIKTNESIQKFIKWVAKKNPDFYEKTKQSNRKK